jgi:hypothetical protein
VFNKDVAKVDRDIAHVAMGYICMFQVYCSRCFICFICMLQVFHLDVAKLDQDVVYICKYLRCFYTYVGSVSS